MSLVLVLYLLDYLRKTLQGVKLTFKNGSDFTVPADDLESFVHQAHGKRRSKHELWRYFREIIPQTGLDMGVGAAMKLIAHVMAKVTGYTAPPSKSAIWSIHLDETQVRTYPSYFFPTAFLEKPCNAIPIFLCFCGLSGSDSV
jgi:hypothetical protein